MKGDTEQMDLKLRIISASRGTKYLFTCSNTSEMFYTLVVFTNWKCSDLFLHNIYDLSDEYHFRFFYP
jgi:hypothetical protein